MEIFWSTYSPAGSRVWRKASNEEGPAKRRAQGQCVGFVSCPCFVPLLTPHSLQIMANQWRYSGVPTPQLDPGCGGKRQMRRGLQSAGPKVSVKVHAFRFSVHTMYQ